MGKEVRSNLLKVLAVVSSVGLATGYVYWKRGDPKPVKSDAVEEGDYRPGELEQLKLMVGSKSPGGDVLVFPEQKVEASDGESQPPLLPSSKWIQLSGPSARELPGQNGEVTVLPSTKSFRVLPFEPETVEIDGKKIKVLPGSKSLAPIFETREEEEEP